MSTKRITEYKIGSDPEVFLIDKETGDIVSAIPFVPGDKHNPYQIPGLKDGCMIQTDNIMVEYCVPATTNSKEFYEYIQDCIEYTNKNLPHNLEVIVKASTQVNSKYLEDPRTQVFGWTQPIM